MDSLHLNFLLGFVAVLGVGLVRAACPMGWAKDDLAQVPSCFHYIPTEATFEDAQRACRHVGGELITPKTMLDTAGMQYFIQTAVIPSHQKDVWLDMKQHGDEWKSFNGSSNIISPIPWREGYPEGDGECGVLLWNPGQMKNKDCKLKASVLCRAPEDSVHSLEPCSDLELPATTFAYDLIYDEEVSAGSYAYLSCEEGFVLSSTGHKKTYCNKAGSWSKSVEELAKCLIESCEEIVMGKKVIEVTEGDSQVGSLRNFTCPEGTTFKKQKNVWNVSVRCDERGQWVTIDEQEVITSIDDCVKADPVGSASTMTLSLCVSLLAMFSSLFHL